MSTCLATTFLQEDDSHDSMTPDIACWRLLFNAGLKRNLLNHTLECHFLVSELNNPKVDLLHTWSSHASWGIQINECYGMSESTAACALSTQRCHLWGSCGFQLPGFEVKAFQVDPETWSAQGSMERYVRDIWYAWIEACMKLTKFEERTSIYLNERSYSCQALMTLAIGLRGDGEISSNCCDRLIAWESIQLAKVATSCTDKHQQRTSIIFTKQSIYKLRDSITV